MNLPGTWPETNFTQSRSAINAVQYLMHKSIKKAWKCVYVCVVRIFVCLFIFCLTQAGTGFGIVFLWFPWPCQKSDDTWGVPFWGPRVPLCHHLHAMPFHLSPASNQWALRGNKQQTQETGHCLSLRKRALVYSPRRTGFAFRDKAAGRGLLGEE